MLGIHKTKISLDWSGETAKVLRVRTGGNRPVLVDFSVQTLRRPGQLAPLLREFGAGGVLSSVTCSFPERELHIRQLELPLQNHADLAATLPFEVRRHLPFAATGEVSLAHQTVGVDREGGKMSVLAVAIPTGAGHRHAEQLEEAGVSVGRMEPAPLAAVNHLLHSEAGTRDGTCWGLVDIGETGTWIAFGREGGPLYVRSVHVGGASFTQEIVVRCGLSRREADRVKRAEVALTKVRPEWKERPSSLPRLIRHSMEQLALEVSAHMGNYRKKEGPVRRLFITGGGSLVHGIEKGFEAKLAVPARLVDPFEPFEFATGWTDRKREMLASLGPQFVVAAGLTRWWES